MPLLHHDRTVPTTRRSTQSVRSDTHSHGHTRTHPRTAHSTVGTARSTVAPVQTATINTATKPSLLTRLAHGSATTATSRPQPYTADSYGAQTTAATMDGPTSHVPRYARGYAAPPPDPMRRHVPTVGDRMHGAAKKVAGTLMLDRNKRAEGRAMETGAPVQPVKGTSTVVPSVVGGRRHAHSTRYHL